ncbi:MULTISPECIES: hypothetical protein [unclassified Streptomyces]|uniref:hypothetical protein n=1 Tax=unclassified Streptomyces TaxID=2593676 RepID=UPI002DDA133E|nr:hypothetical protein [Streptomyces sp. NBC_01766]WSC24903.1 hypothetical protein OIE60_35130 [Streptomyces sp. NBC_01766]
MNAHVLIITPEAEPLPRLLTGTEIPLSRRNPFHLVTAEWLSAALIIIDDRCSTALFELGFPRRRDVLLLGKNLDDATIFGRGVALGVEAVVHLPDAAAWLELRAHAATGGVYVQWERLLGPGTGEPSGGPVP